MRRINITLSRSILLGLMVLQSVGCSTDPVNAGSSEGIIYFNEAEPYLCGDCNVLLVVFDTLRADHLGVYGYHRNTSPFIDSLSFEGIVFEYAISQSSWTLPSHMSVFTGLYPESHGVINERFRLGNETVTFADILHDNGYRTAAFTGGGLVSKRYNYHTFDIYDESGGRDGSNFESMLSWLKNNSDTRFLLFYHDFQVHSPYIPDSQHDIFSDTGYDGIVDVYPDRNESVCKGNQQCQSKHGAYFSAIMDNMDEEDLDYIISKYDGEIRIADDKFRRIIQALDEAGVRNKTIIILTSDHGETLGDRELFKKVGHGIPGSMYHELLHVPLIIWLPESRQYERVSDVVELIDIAPTITSLLGLSGGEGFEGDSLFPSKGNKYAFSSRNQLGIAESSLTSMDFKLIFNHNSSIFEFYDLKNDPNQRQDLYSAGVFNEQIYEMVRILSSSYKELYKEEYGKNKSSGYEPDEELLDELRSLGYLN